MIDWIVPGSLEQATGGYAYDRHIIAGLRACGFELRVHELPGAYPEPDAVSRAALESLLASLTSSDPRGHSPSAQRPFVIDGLANAIAPDAVISTAARRPMVAMIHHLLGDEAGDLTHIDEECRVLASASALVVSSAWTARRIARVCGARGEVGDGLTATAGRSSEAVSQSMSVIEPGVEVFAPAGADALAAMEMRWQTIVPDRDGSRLTSAIRDAASAQSSPRLSEQDAQLSWDSGQTTDRSTLDPSADRVRACEAPARRWLCVASLIPRKGHDVLLEAVGRVPGIALMVIGEPRDEAWAATLEARAQRADLAGRVCFVKQASNEMLAAAYATAEGFVLASRFEGFGMVITEAERFGLPIVTTEGGALVDTAAAAWRVPVDAVDALSAALAVLSCDARRCAELAAAARLQSGRRADWAMQARRFADVIDAASRVRRREFR
ncbi:MAG: glycosyltransferase family 4 protein [Thioalkalivibrionaceae bacterium]